MKQYWIEGLYKPNKITNSSHKRAAQSATIEPFYMSFWAESPEDALNAAIEEIKGGQWLEGPRISQSSEEQRMRALGAPELPGFEPVKKIRKK
ncbi:MAG: hypothetical protein P4L50_03415 [Anaerolineaceae bacterium]|nr:hypothetical protein [Anaerolineaceae bacterium]